MLHLHFTRAGSMRRDVLGRRITFTGSDQSRRESSRDFSAFRFRHGASGYNESSLCSKLTVLCATFCCCASVLLFRAWSGEKMVDMCDPAAMVSSIQHLGSCRSSCRTFLAMLSGNVVVCTLHAQSFPAFPDEFLHLGLVSFPPK